jgi:superfamily II DNA or RNA helicase
MTEDQQARLLRDLREGLLELIVQVQMLGEGFDHPPLSVAAIFRREVHLGDTAAQVVVKQAMDAVGIEPPSDP